MTLEVNRLPVQNFPYSNLHYSYINPSSTYRNNNGEKRQRHKDKYTDIYFEKKNYVTYEIDPTGSGRFGHSCDNFRPKREIFNNCDIISRSRSLHRNKSCSNVKDDNNNLYLKTLKTLRNRKCICQCHRTPCDCHASYSERDGIEKNKNIYCKINKGIQPIGTLVRTNSQILNKKMPNRDATLKNTRNLKAKGVSTSLPSSERSSKNGKKQQNGNNLNSSNKISQNIQKEKLDLMKVANSSHPYVSFRNIGSKENITHNNTNDFSYRNNNDIAYSNKNGYAYQNRNDYTYRANDDYGNSNRGFNEVESPNYEYNGNRYEDRLQELRKRYKEDYSPSNNQAQNELNDGFSSLKSTMKSTTKNHRSQSTINVDQSSSNNFIDDRQRSINQNSKNDFHNNDSLTKSEEENLISPRFQDISSDEKSMPQKLQSKSRQKKAFSFKGNNSGGNEKENAEEECYKQNIDSPDNLRFGISDKISPIKNQKSPLNSSANFNVTGNYYHDYVKQIAKNELNKLKNSKISIEKKAKLNRIKDKVSMMSFEKDFKKANITSIHNKLQKITRSSSMKNINKTKYQKKLFNSNLNNTTNDDFYKDKNEGKTNNIGEMLVKIPNHGYYFSKKSNIGLFNQFTKEKIKKKFNFSISYGNFNNGNSDKVIEAYNSRYTSVMPPNPYGSVLEAREFYFFND